MIVVLTERVLDFLDIIPIRTICKQMWESQETFQIYPPSWGHVIRGSRLCTVHVGLNEVTSELFSPVMASKCFSSCGHFLKPRQNLSTVLRFPGRASYCYAQLRAPRSMTKTPVACFHTCYQSNTVGSSSEVELTSVRYPHIQRGDYAKVSEMTSGSVRS